MKKLVNLAAGLFCTAVSFVATASPSQAFTHSTAYVSGAGSDANPCTKALPCRSILNTIGTVTGDGGVVICLDAGPYLEGGSLNYSYTVDCPGIVNPTTFSNNYAFNLSNTNNGSHQVVTFRNVVFDGKTGGGGGAISIGGAARVLIENCTFQNFNNSPGIAVMMQIFDDLGPREGQLIIRNSVFVNNGLPQSGGAIIVQPSGVSSARVVIERTTVGHNTYGVFANGAGTTGSILLHMKDSVATNNQVHGISAYTPSGGITSLVLDHTSSLLNGSAGILAQGTGAFVTLTDSTVMSNVTGLSKLSGGNIYSYGNNRLTGNVSEGAAPTTGTFVLK